MLSNNLVKKHKNNSDRTCNFQTRTGKNRNNTIDLIEAEKRVFFLIEKIVKKNLIKRDPVICYL